MGDAQASKLTVSQVEIGFDILKARDVPAEVGGIDEAEAVSAAVSGAVMPSAAAASSRNSTGENTAAAFAAAATLLPGDRDNKDAVEVVDDKRKRYRLMVKRRLLKRHGEELSTDASTRKRQLEELYRDVEADLLRSGAKLNKERGKSKNPMVAEA